MRRFILICLILFGLKSTCYSQNKVDSVDINSIFLKGIPLDSPYSTISWQTDDFTEEMLKKFKFHKRLIGKEYIAHIDSAKMMDGITLYHVEMYGRKRKKWGNKLVLLYLSAKISIETADRLSALFNLKFAKRFYYPKRKPVYTITLTKSEIEARIHIGNTGVVYKF